VGDTAELLKALVSQFAGVVKEVQRGNSAVSASRSGGVLKAPRFDGTSDVHLFIRQFAEVQELSGWSDRLALVQLRNCLDKGARDCGRADTLSGVYSTLLGMFGLTPTEARERLHSLKQDTEESYVKLGARVERLIKIAYGGLGSEIEMQMALEHFDRAIVDPALRRHLLVAPARTLREVVSAAERYDLVGPQPLRLSRARDSARVAPVQSLPTSVEGEHGRAPGDGVEGLLKSITEKLDAQATLMKEQSTRMSALEKENQARANQRQTSKKGCFRCGDTSHFIRDCPKQANSAGAGAGRKPPTPQAPENC
jgi:hypothetical protein